jgi:adenine/guanine phosphoribosyltransferase-like PRPP-binding protein
MLPTYDLVEKTRELDKAVITEIRNFIRKEDMYLFEGMDRPSVQMLIRVTWCSLSNASKPEKDKEENRQLIRNIFELYSRSDPMAVLRHIDPRNVFADFVEREEISLMLQNVKRQNQVLVPVMMGGIFPGAVIYDYLKKNNLLLDVAFAGHIRSGKTLVPEYYKEESVHLSQWDLEILKKHTKEKVLIVDDVIETGTTASKVASSLVNIGFEPDNISKVVLKDYVMGKIVSIK